MINLRKVVLFPLEVHLAAHCHLCRPRGVRRERLGVAFAGGLVLLNAPALLQFVPQLLALRLDARLARTVFLVRLCLHETSCALFCTACVHATTTKRKKKIVLFRLLALHHFFPFPSRTCRFSHAFCKDSVVSNTYVLFTPPG